MAAKKKSAAPKKPARRPSSSAKDEHPEEAKLEWESTDEPEPVALPPPEPMPAPPPEPTPPFVPEPAAAPMLSAAPAMTSIAPPSPEPASAPAQPVAPPKQWLSVAEPAAEASNPVVAPAGPEDTWLVRATRRRGVPWLVALGTILALLGLVVLLYSYYAAYNAGSGDLPAPAGLRGDYLAAILVAVGLGIAVTFLFVPSNKAYGLGPAASREQWQEEAKLAQSALRMAQLFVGIGIGLITMGLLWMVYFVYLGYTDGQMRSTSLAGRDLPTFYLGGILLVLGLLVVMFFWGSVAGARRRENLAVVALIRTEVRAPAPGVLAAALPAGVTEAEVQALMKRLDGLMAQLPDAAVTEFSKTSEADTYLKLLGSS
jgi:hypothetical protein